MTSIFTRPWKSPAADVQLRRVADTPINGELFEEDRYPWAYPNLRAAAEESYEAAIHAHNNGFERQRDMHLAIVKDTYARDVVFGHVVPIGKQQLGFKVHVLTENMRGPLTRIGWKDHRFNWGTIPLAEYDHAIPLQAHRAITKVKELRMPFDDFHVAQNDKIVIVRESLPAKFGMAFMAAALDPYLLGRIDKYGIALAFWI